MNSSKMFLGLVPWLLFSVMVNRRGADSAGVAALAAAGLALVFLMRGGSRSTVKLLDVTAIATFGALAAACFVEGAQVTGWAADYGRGFAALLLAAVMLLWAVTVPFTEQYARESVAQRYWHTRAFRALNRRLSAVWGVAVAAMAGGHLLAGKLDPVTASKPGERMTDLLLNWVVPVVLILLSISYSKHVSAEAGRRASAQLPSNRIELPSPVGSRIR